MAKDQVNSAWFKWAISLLVAIIITLTGVIFGSSVSGRMDKLEANKADRQEVMFLKENIADLKGTQSEILRTVKKIEINQARNEGR